MSLYHREPAQPNTEHKVNFVFDQQNDYDTYALESYQYMLSMPDMPERFGDLAFKPKTGVGGLQAGDLLAYSMYRSLSTTQSSNRHSAQEFAQAKRAIDRKIGPLVQIWGQPELRSFIDRAQPEVLAYMKGR
jgi:hypothetical protein